jgi:uncharacterized repeat protein (TIGR01451 family)
MKNILAKGTLVDKTLVFSLVLVLLIGPTPLVQPDHTLADGNDLAGDALVQLPFYFIANQGQQDKSVVYYALGSEHSIYFTAQEVVISLDALGETHLRTRFVGAEATQPIGAEKMAAQVNHFVGADPTRWRTGIPTYGQIVYYDLYPGLDLHYAGQTGVLKYTLVAAPGADVSQFQLAYEGATGLRVDETGDLLIRVGESELRDTRPYAYQEIDGRQVEVETAFVLHEHGPSQSTHTVGFSVQGDYDPRYPLIVDPTLDYATFLGGSDLEEANSIAVDGDGYVYITGMTRSTGFPTTAGVFQPAYSGGMCGLFEPYVCGDAFVAKIDPRQSGASSLVYATFLGGGYKPDLGQGIAVDAVGNVYVKGVTVSPEFPTTPNAYQPTCASCPDEEDAFFTKLNADGSALLYSTYLGGSAEEFASTKGMAVDEAGNAYVVGYTWSTDFPTTPNAYQPAFAGGEFDVFVTKIDTTQSGASSLVYSTYLGGSTGGYGPNSGKDFGTDLALDGNNNVYVVGYTYSDDFPTRNPYKVGDPSSNDRDIFVTKLDTTQGGDDSLIYSTYLGGSEMDRGTGIAVDGAGNAYVTGDTDSDDFPVWKPYQAIKADTQPDIFITKFNAAGDALLYSTYFGGSWIGDRSGVDYGTSVAVDGVGNAYVTGYTAAIDFPTKDPYQATNAGGKDAVVIKINTTLSGTASLRYSTYLGGSDESTNEWDNGTDIAVDEMGNVYVVGLTSSADFPITQNAYQGTHGGGGRDGFVAKFDLGEYPDLSASSKRVSPTTLEPPGTLLLNTLHYTITLSNTGPLTATAARLTDTLPLSLTLATSPVCSDGACGYIASSHLITWTGSLAPEALTTITYTGWVSAVIGPGEAIFIVNSAQVNDGVNAPFTLAAWVAVNPRVVYLPSVMRSFAP